jgi:glycosyltransferase involved in cell wall biosynthesis
LTCILTSHRKPRFVHDAIASVLSQSTPDWQLVVIDSGSLINADEFDRYKSDPRILVAASGETPDMRDRIGLQARAINEASRRGLVRGDLVCYLSDDDVYYAEAFAAFLAAARSSPWQAAWYGIADRTEVRSDGAEVKLGELPAAVIGGVGSASLDGRADGMQVCHRRELLPRVPWPEQADVAWHSDGVFLERLGKNTAIHPIAAKLGRHRHTGDSTFTRAADSSQLAKGERPIVAGNSAV